MALSQGILIYFLLYFLCETLLCGLLNFTVIQQPHETELLLLNSSCSIVDSSSPFHSIPSKRYFPFGIHAAPVGSSTMEDQNITNLLQQYSNVENDKYTNYHEDSTRLEKEDRLSSQPTTTASSLHDASSSSSTWFAQRAGTITAVTTSGGKKVNNGTHFIHTFNSSGFFSVDQYIPEGDGFMIVVAGGGGGGYNGGGGGGGGDIRSAYTNGMDIRTCTITIGQGGAGQTSTSTSTAGSGGNSIINTGATAFTAIGGGGGGAKNNNGK